MAFRETVATAAGNADGARLTPCVPLRDPDPDALAARP